MESRLHQPRPRRFRAVRRAALVFVLALVLAPVVFFAILWSTADGNQGGQQPAEPFRIAGNFYYVGANDVTSFLITGPQGHVLIDGGYTDTPQLIMASIARLGFDIKDVKVLLNSHEHHDHAGGLAALQQASGAELWASTASADVLASGGRASGTATWSAFGLVWRALGLMGIGTYPAPRVDHRFTDGQTIRLGPIALTGHVTAGHSRGCTSWSFPVRDGDRVLNVVSACSMRVMGGMQYPGQEADLERTFRVLRSLPADIWVTAHAREWGRYRKFLARDTARDPVDPFIDPDGYRAFVDAGEADFRNGRTY